jgi:hypothetical protein
LNNYHNALIFKGFRLFKFVQVVQVAGISAAYICAYSSTQVLNMLFYTYIKQPDNVNSSHQSIDIPLPGTLRDHIAAAFVSAFSFGL